MQKKKILCGLISVFAIGTCFAAEIDSVTPRKLTLDNSIDTLNDIINQRIDEGIRKANAQQDYFGDSEDMLEQVIPGYTQAAKDNPGDFELLNFLPI